MGEKIQQKDINKLFVTLGWEKHVDEVNVSYFTKSIDDFILLCIPRLRSVPEGHYIDVLSSLSTPAFNTIVGQLLDREVTEEVIVQNSERLELSTDIGEDLQLLSDRIVEWAKAQDIEKGIEQFRKVVGEYGQPQLYHISALILSGDVAILQSYLALLKSGDSGTFVPMITEVMLEKAVQLAT